MLQYNKDQEGVNKMSLLAFIVTMFFVALAVIFLLPLLVSEQKRFKKEDEEKYGKD